uniref:(northern house mosquito) hypothetical protein n=1 Tax=Culex pipiens TaxID=7175 RepID=A0A8D8FDX5_CULPI
MLADRRIAFSNTSEFSLHNIEQESQLIRSGSSVIFDHRYFNVYGFRLIFRTLVLAQKFFQIPLRLANVLYLSSIFLNFVFQFGEDGLSYLVHRRERCEDRMLLQHFADLLTQVWDIRERREPLSWFSEL